MKRHIRISEEEYEWLKKRAKEELCSTTEMLRRIIAAEKKRDFFERMNSGYRNA